MNTDVVRTINTFPEHASFIDSLDVAPATVLSYKKKVHAFMEWVRENHVIEPTSADILAYKKSLVAKGLSPSSINQYLSAVRAFFRWAEAEGRYPDIARSVKNEKTPRGRSKDDLTPDQVTRVLEACNDEREYALLLLLFATGMRTVEVERANRGNLRTRGGRTVLYVHGKGRTSADEYIKITEPVEQALSAYFATRPGLSDDSPLFTSISPRNRGARLSALAVQRTVVGVFVRAGIRAPKAIKSRITPHSTRHTAITMMLKAGASTRETQAVARHRRFETTEIYAHDIDRLNSPAEELLTQAILGA